MEGELKSVLYFCFTSHSFIFSYWNEIQNEQKAGQVLYLPYPTAQFLRSPGYE